MIDLFWFAIVVLAWFSGIMVGIALMLRQYER